MDIHLQVPDGVKSSSLKISGSKSETNRLLLLQSLYPGISFNNASESDDSEVMRKALSANDNNIDVHHAGTAMRFLTAYYAIQEGKKTVITGSSRMKERPIGVLVNALCSLGANIEYAENEGFPPLTITGKKLHANKVTIKANVSSQYITALLLIAPKLEKGLEINLDGEITSRPYLEMTLALLTEVGIKHEFKDNTIFVEPLIDVTPVAITVESDWSSASYFYSIVALADVGTSISLTSYKQNSLQGDSALAKIYSDLGVDTFFESDTIVLCKNRKAKPVFLNLINTPDIAQTIAVTCFGLGVGCYLTGLHTLKIKETDRLEALKTELEKFGAIVEVTNDSLKIEPHNLFDAVNKEKPDHKGPVNTYNDHRMAMAFAPLAIKVPFIINEAEVVSKSYPAFWDDLKKCGFKIRTI
ncbi:3-phosphoshikimate 1-carboxyvinyltransferase [Flavobacterium sp. NRK1]|uniref:3-phosphoshikimate 1-carboxyvinyltransferase n=1 Tax=Flavobacterium sp. NRK1 TaxID=2954929 RepID=UPI0020939899|nr:3-phosphoshikimate 1-carboxyvinyltransferase [Flavobacterium sp. NRK1]MCO6148186.1 3-phosphoshikimate 1-carboxyvinyltransferase [Flavobacterium sp. NRK1]